MSEIALVTRNTPQQDEPQRTKLQEVLGTIPPARHEQEISAALEAESQRRAEIKSKLDELSTDELERIFTASRRTFSASIRPTTGEH